MVAPGERERKGTPVAPSWESRWEEEGEGRRGGEWESGRLTFAISRSGVFRPGGSTEVRDGGH